MLAVACLAVALVGAAGASAETSLFTKAGCEAWTVPAKVHELHIEAVGAAGAKGNSSMFEGPGGNGDGFSATLATTPAQNLFVCVDQGGGALKPSPLPPGPS